MPSRRLRVARLDLPSSFGLDGRPRAHEVHAAFHPFLEVSFMSRKIRPFGDKVTHNDEKVLLMDESDILAVVE
jgi:hypothetical protein